MHPSIAVGSFENILYDAPKWNVKDLEKDSDVLAAKAAKRERKIKSMSVTHELGWVTHTTQTTQSSNNIIFYMY